MINKSEKLYIQADKSRTIYKTKTNDYKKQVQKEVTKFYKTTSNETEYNIKKEAKIMAAKLKPETESKTTKSITIHQTKRPQG